MASARLVKIAAVGAALILALVVSTIASAHCDALDGPVVADARLALKRGDVTRVLKWVPPGDEAEVRDLFRHTVAVRAGGSEARALADRLFFETLVRLHRAGEGEPFTGLKPAGHVDPGLAAADEALATGSADALAAALSDGVQRGLARRHALALERRKHAEASVEAGREWVEAYVDYAHFVESLHRLAAEGASHAHHE